MPKAKPTTVTGYIKAAPNEERRHLRDIRAILKKVAPKATEALKWGSPAFEENRRSIAAQRVKELREEDARWM